MAENLSNSPHPLANNGTSQQQRSLAAQLPGFVSVDEHTTPDLLEYVFQLARTVVYHEVEAEQLRKSDWQDFFRLSVPIQLALLAKFDVAKLRSDFQAAQQNFASGLGRGDLEQLFSQVFDLARTFNRWHLQFTADTPLKSALENLITNDLRFTFSQLVAIGNEAELKLGAAEYRRPQNLQDFINNPIWQFSAGSLMLAGIPASPTSAQAKGTVNDKKQFYAKRAGELFQIFIQGVERLVSIAQNTDIQQKSIESIASHQPHIALLLAFTRMFKLLQDDLNSLGEKHLDFYLRDVLCLQPKPAEPDHAHLVVELDKLVPKYKLSEGKAFKASGKDKKGQEMQFGLDAETVLNQAQVVELRTLYRDTGADAPKGPPAVVDGPLKRIRVAEKANSFDGRGLDFEDPAAATWETLGSLRPKKAELFNAAGRIGFIIASPTLLLNEGDGSVEITLTFDTNLPASADLPDKLFQLSYSGKKDWVPTAVAATTSAKVLTLKFDIAVGGEPLTFADPKVLKVDYSTTDPMVSVMLNTDEGFADWTSYDEFSSKLITNLHLKVTANRVRNLVLSNDEGAIDPNKPFMPFGALPHIGSDFIVGSEEAFRKKLTVVNLHATWDKLPLNESFGSYYEWYDQTVPAQPKPQNADFKANLHFMQDGAWVPASSEVAMPLPFQLFGTNNAVPPPANAVFEIDTQLGKASRLKESLAPYSIHSRSGFVKLSLTGSDFRHDIYPKVLAGRLAEIAGSGFSPATLASINNRLNNAQTNLDNAAPKLSSAESVLSQFPIIPPIIPTVWANNQIVPADSLVSSAINDIGFADGWVTSVQNLLASVKSQDLPNQPYTPTIKEFYLSYTAECDWTPAAAGDMTFAHLHPYEAQNHEKQLKMGGFSLLPKFSDEGSLYIGLKNLLPGGSLNLLFQMAEATANPDVEPLSSDSNYPELPDWQYLQGNAWKKLRPGFEVRHDATKGLIASGIVELTIPFDASSEGTTILPSQFQWLRVSYNKGTAGVSESVAVHAQAIKTTFNIALDEQQKPLNDTARLALPLPAANITKPVVDDAALKKIKQPYESFGGRPEEDDTTFRRRAGEHLRHKGRSIALYDYERMVLENFPGVYKVKCLTHTHVFKNSTGIVRDFYIAPGHVALAVIPDITRFGFAEKLRPCASRALLLDIETYLKKHSSPFVKVHAVNPVFQEVDIEVTMVLRPDKDPAFYQEALAQDILRFMTPWAFGENDQLAFGGKLYKSSILNFVETLDYIDYVVTLTLNDPAGEQPDSHVLFAKTERSILVAGKITINHSTACTANADSSTGLVGLGHEKINTLKING